MLDTNRGVISVTHKRISKLKTSIVSIPQGHCSHVKVRYLASVVGQIISLTPCVGNVTRIMTRSLYAVVDQGVSWSSTVELTREARDELQFWNQNVDSLNGCSPWRAIAKPAKLVNSDASSQAYGSFIENEGKVFHQNWSQIESKESST